MEEKLDSGVVTELLPENKAKVKVHSLGNCDSCGAKEACSVFSQKGDRFITACCAEEVSPGDLVEIEIKAISRITASLFIFVTPLLFLFAGYLISFSFLKAEGPSILISFISLALSVPIISLIAKKLPFLQRTAPYIKKLKHSE